MYFAYDFNFDHSLILSFGKELSVYRNIPTFNDPVEEGL